jgi:hypothetical protein
LHRTVRCVYSWRPSLSHRNLVSGSRSLPQCRKRTPAKCHLAGRSTGNAGPRTSRDGINTCNTYTAGPLPTWSSANCISDVGTFDMVGNVSEWVADWVPVSAGCVNPMFSSGDFNCFAASNVPSPGGLQHQYAAGTSPLAHLPGCSPLMPS